MVTYDVICVVVNNGNHFINKSLRRTSRRCKSVFWICCRRSSNSANNTAVRDPNIVSRIIVGANLAVFNINVPYKYDALTGVNPPVGLVQVKFLGEKLKPLELRLIINRALFIVHTATE